MRDFLRLLARGSGSLLDGNVLGESVEERVGPAFLVAGAAESVVQDPTGLRAQIAADLMSEQKMSQKQISSLSNERVRISE